MSGIGWYKIKLNKLKKMKKREKIKEQTRKNSIQFSVVLSVIYMVIILGIVIILAKSYIDLIDGLVLTGGTNVSPKFYQEEPEDAQNCNPVRDRCELELFKQAYKQKIPILGICRGMQLMNVAFGGSLYQGINKLRIVG